MENDPAPTAAPTVLTHVHLLQEVVDAAENLSDYSGESITNVINRAVMVYQDMSLAGRNEWFRLPRPPARQLDGGRVVRRRIEE